MSDLGSVVRIGIGFEKATRPDLAPEVAAARIIRVRHRNLVWRIGDDPAALEQEPLSLELARPAGVHVREGGGVMPDDDDALLTTLKPKLREGLWSQDRVVRATTRAFLRSLSPPQMRELLEAP